MKTVKVLFFFSLSSLIACSGARITALEESTAKDIRDIRSFQAETTASLNQFRQELREIQGSIELLQHSSQGKAQQLEQSLRRLGSRVPPPQGVPEKYLSSDEERISRITGPSAEEFKLGLGSLRAGDFESAKNLFTKFATENPGTAFTDNALFWIGICNIKTGRYDQAVVSFSDVYQTYPAEDMVAPALFHLSTAFEKLGSRQDAIDTLKKLVDDHPKSRLVADARSGIRRLKRRK